jgi:hypothetical protein
LAESEEEATRGGWNDNDFSPLLRRLVVLLVCSLSMYQYRGTRNLLELGTTNALEIVVDSSRCSKRYRIQNTFWAKSDQFCLLCLLRCGVPRLSPSIVVY